MEQVSKAIYSLGQRDWFDYITIIAPLLLSVVAVCVSVFIMRKQNKIALFQIRYNVIHYVSLILQFADESECWIGDGGPIPLFNAAFAANLKYPPGDPVEVEQEVVTKLNNIKKEIMTARFVFSKRDVAKIEKMMKLLKDYVLECGESLDPLKYRDAFCEYCSAYQKKDFQQLMKKVRL